MLSSFFLLFSAEHLGNALFFFLSLLKRRKKVKRCLPPLSLFTARAKRPNSSSLSRREVAKDFLPLFSSAKRDNVLLPSRIPFFPPSLFVRIRVRLYSL